MSGQPERDNKAARKSAILAGVDCAAYRPCLATSQSNALFRSHPIESGKCLKRGLSEVEANTFPRFGHSPHPCARAKQCFADPRSPDQVWEMFRTRTAAAAAFVAVLIPSSLGNVPDFRPESLPAWALRGLSALPCGFAKQCFASASPHQVWEMFRTSTSCRYRGNCCGLNPIKSGKCSGPLKKRTRPIWIRLNPIESGKCSGLSPRILSGLGSARPIGFALRPHKAMLCFGLTRSSLGNVPDSVGNWRC